MTALRTAMLMLALMALASLVMAQGCPDADPDCGCYHHGDECEDCECEENDCCGDCHGEDCTCDCEGVDCEEAHEEADITDHHDDGNGHCGGCH